MNTRFPVYLLLAVIIILLSACQPATIAPSPQPTRPPTQTAPPTPTPVTLTATPTPIQPTRPSPGGIALDYSAVAQNVTVETVSAVPGSADSPFWEAAPQYRRLTLQGYPVANPLFKPQIFIYSVSDLAAANENMGKIAADLQALLKTHQAENQLPFLPLSNLAQLMRAQVVFQDFKSSQGVSFVTQLDQGLMPVTNTRLIYAFQGLTSDGKFYIAAVLPVTHPELPGGTRVSEPQFKTPEEFRDYLSKTVTLLNEQPAGSFTPDLNKLDALIRSIEVR